jgi:hypothetical protein
MKPATILLTALLAGVSMGAAAQNENAQAGQAGDMGGQAGGQAQTQTFTELDQNNDGILDQDEFEQANMNKDFSELDANGDSEIDRSEYYQAQRQQ